MNTPKLSLWGLETLCWAARILGTLVVLLFLVFLVGEGPPRLSTLTALEKLLFVANGTMLRGLILAWKWRGLGGALAQLGYLFFGALAGLHSALVIPFAAGGLSGILHVAGWWLPRPLRRSAA